MDFSAASKPHVLHTRSCTKHFNSSQHALIAPRNGMQRRLSVAVAASTQAMEAEVHSAASTMLVSPHPDAVRRRQLQQEWRRKQEEQRKQATLAAQQGLRWFEASCPANMVVCTSPDEFKRLISQAAMSGQLLVAKFFTEECYVCKSLHPKIKSIAKDNPDVLWVNLNGSDPNLAGMFHALGINKVPLFHMVRDGELVSELTASLNPERLARFRAELAAHKPSAAGSMDVPQ